ncbi:FACT complex subunit-domain-containing protein [Radiomyces spectabilis]|uniref:FACT complex subunit-domain-containing protein n=1 Tax=Radiomyces spectabilis TaxID=64574 RepID=UPI00221EB985|nr:FACT complex subunit-domain-containing protein [Radiomyces spectabilis]KAI8393680.1 FACT complex subunit-domain-containing protein [Radiomyces spectabilis]
MATIEIDAKRFHKRARFLLSQWKSPTNAELFQNVDALVLLVGDDDEENPYRKSVTAQTWLLGFPIFQTLIVFTPEKITFVCSMKKADVLETVKRGDKQVPVDIIRRGKNIEQNVPLYEPLVEALSGKRVGVIVKDKFKGKNVDEWNRAWKQAGKSFEEVDIAPAVSACLAVKDEEEVRTMRIAAKISSNVMKNYFIDEMSTIVDEEKKVSHEKLAEQTEEALLDPKMAKRLRIPPEVENKDDIDWCYTPIIQSGGNYDLRSSAVSDNKPLHAGVIICSLGARYKYYCSNIGRTFLIDPSKIQEKNYEFLVDLQTRVLDNIRDGVKIKDIYQKALGYIKSKRPDLEKHFTKNIGFGMGIEFREGSYVLSAKNVRELKNGMVVNLSLGFADLENPKPADDRSKMYSLLLIDTIRVTMEAPTMLTDCSKRLNEISYFFKDEGGDAEMAEASKAPARPVKKEPLPKSAILRSKFRSEEQEEESREQKRKEHQKQLFAQKLAEGLAKFSEGGENGQNESKAVFRKFESYRTEAKLPREIRDQKIIVDKRAESIILPIYGMAVPFHISTLKNASKSDEGDFVMLRLNFLTPGQAGGKKEDMPFDDPTATFVRALTFRSADTHRMAEIFRNITDLKKDAAKKEAQRKEMADVVEQDNLIQVKGRRPLRLPDVYVRPQVDGKRLPGELEIHTNGLRYQSIRSDNSFNVLFSNVKHLFFQPCDNELLVLIHIHFKNPVLIGKKKTKDIQFYREASDIQFDETGNKRRRHVYGDEDELESEQEERRRRANLNKEFKVFAEKIAEASDGRIEVDIPFRELGFQGVPFRSNVLLQPTTDCLVHLSDPPFLIITLSDIEIAHLERVQFGLKNFDMVFVFKDFHRQPIQINTIPMAQLDNVKDWLDSVEVAFTEGPVNLNWSMIMKTVNEDPAEFYKNGGWNFLGAGSDDEDPEDQSDSASEFEISSEELEESSSDDESDYGSNASEDEEEEEELSDSGEDWDELEEKARKADERKMKRNGEEEEAPRKKMRR